MVVRCESCNALQLMITMRHGELAYGEYGVLITRAPA
jgi:hypothetical protein